MTLSLCKVCCEQTLCATCIIIYWIMKYVANPFFISFISALLQP